VLSDRYPPRHDGGDGTVRTKLPGVSEKNIIGANSSSTAAVVQVAPTGRSTSIDSVRACGSATASKWVIGTSSGTSACVKRSGADGDTRQSDRSTGGLTSTPGVPPQSHAGPDEELLKSTPVSF
jgi:hypothetical protein